MSESFQEIVEMLRAREKEIESSIEALPSDLHQRDDHVGDSIDKSVAQVDHASASALREREVISLHQIRDALARIEDGTYGDCKSCDEAIPYKRLLANPLTTLCVTCQEEVEMDEGAAPKKKRSFFDT